MCFSPEVDASAGIIVTGIGIDALRHVRSKEHVALAALPLLFGVHQLVETFVWLGLQDRVSPTLANAATWTYLLIALVIVPALVPFAFVRLGGGRWPVLSKFFLAAGVVAAAVDASALGFRNVPRVLDAHQITYHLSVPFGEVSFLLYVVAACGPGLTSRAMPLQLLGVLNLGVVGTLAWLNRDGVISLWCVWAAATSVLINLYVRDALPAGWTSGREPEPTGKG